MKRSMKFLIAAVAALLAVGGVAYAAWQVSGSGSGAGKAATASNLTVTAGTAVPAAVTARRRVRTPPSRPSPSFGRPPAARD